MYEKVSKGAAGVGLEDFNAAVTIGIRAHQDQITSLFQDIAGPGASITLRHFGQSVLEGAFGCFNILNRMRGGFVSSQAQSQRGLSEN